MLKYCLYILFLTNLGSLDMKKYMVGGAVRDRLLGLIPQDIDYVVVGSSPQQMIDQGFKQVGADFPVFLHPTTGEEYALARTERKVGTGYHGFETDYSPDITIEQDLFRRDLTINSMAFDIDTGTLIDPYNGRIDLQNQILRHTSNHFKEDPVRVLRVARFAGRYGFTIDPDTIKMMATMVTSGQLNELTPERVWKEISRGIMEPHADLMYETLKIIHAVYCDDIIPYCGDVDSSQEYIRERLNHPAAKSLAVRMALMCNDNALDAKGRVCSSLPIPLDIARVISSVQLNVPLMKAYPELPVDIKYEVLVSIGAIGSLRNTNLYDEVITAATVLKNFADYDGRHNTGVELIKHHTNLIRKINMQEVIVASTEVPAVSVKHAILNILRK